MATYDYKPNIEEPWMKNYPKGAQRHLEYEVMPLDGLLRQKAEEIPNATCIKFMGNTWTFAEVDHLVDKFAAGLIKLGMKKGDGVLIDLPNCPQFVIAYYATMRAGGVTSPVIPLHKMAEIVYQANDSNASIGIFMDKIYQGYLFGKGIEKIPCMKAVILTGLGDYMPAFTRFMGKKLGKIPYWKKWAKRDGEVPLIDFKNVFEEDTSSIANVKIDPREDTCTLIYTGGTTGAPKGVMLTHYNLVVNCTQLTHWCYQQIDNLPAPGEGSFDIYLPLAHSFGLTLGMNAALTLGYSNVLYAKPPEKGAEYLKNALKNKTTMFPAVPTMWNLMAKDPDSKNYKGKLENLKCGMSGAAALPYEVKNVFEKNTGAIIIEGWGMSEASPLVTANPYVGSKVWTVGFPMSDTWVKITDAETGEKILQQCPHKDPYCSENCGADEAANYIGEIAFCGPQMMKGYLNHPNETAQVIRKDSDGVPFYYTSDIGCIDAEGYLKIKDRKRDMIKRKGHAVFPLEIEDLMYQYEPIFEVGVYGVPDPEAGEEINAAVSLKPEFKDKVTEEDIINWCKENMAPYKYPRKVHIIDELPKSMVGKVLRRVLREEYGNKK
ncbi:MAG: AMP-binding protein [Candidatus Lokiarchaeota archaeon]|nr:AMP-binding protein [Candidatus Lokiarchaeota archaeon]